jgi:hypothetical protein
MRKTIDDFITYLMLNNCNFQGIIYYNYDIETDSVLVDFAYAKFHTRRVIEGRLIDATPYDVIVGDIIQSFKKKWAELPFEGV